MPATNKYIETSLHMHNFSFWKLFYCLLISLGITVVNTLNARDRYFCRPFEKPVAIDSLPNRRQEINPDGFQNENILHPSEPVHEKIKKNLFVRAQVSKSECFVGEPITVTYKLYSRLNAKSSIVAQPLLTGFTKNDIVNVASLDASTEQIGGKIFQVHVLRKTQLIPLIAANLEIDPMEVEHKINFIRSSLDSMATAGQLTDFLHQKKREEQALSTIATINTRSSPLRITVSDTPEENKPSTYSGAVGSFSIKTTFSPQIKITGETARITLEIKGTGSLLSTEPPRISLPENLELLSVKPVLGSYKTGPGSNTSRSFEYNVLFRQPGFIKIPPISFSYFDPVKRIYKTVHSMPIVTQVLENPKQINTKIDQVQDRPVKDTIRSIPIGQTKNVMLLFVMAIVAIAGSIVFFWKKMIRTSTGSLIQPKRKRKDQIADTPFTRAVEKLAVVSSLNKNDPGTYYYELNRVLWAAITEKLDLLPTELSKGNIFLELSRQGWTTEEVWNIELIMTEYERNLYVPGYKDEHDFGRAYENLLRIITKLEATKSKSFVDSQ